MNQEYTIEGLKLFSRTNLLLGPEHMCARPNRIFRNVCLQALRLEEEVEKLQETVDFLNNVLYEAEQDGYALLELDEEYAKLERTCRRYRKKLKQEGLL